MCCCLSVLRLLVLLVVHVVLGRLRRSLARFGRKVSHTANPQTGDKEREREMQTGRERERGQTETDRERERDRDRDRERCRQGEREREREIWLRTNGVNTNGAAAKVMILTDWEEQKVHPGTFRKMQRG